MRFSPSPIKSLCLLGLLFTAVCVGCGGPMVPVSGRVEYEDGSPPQGAIRVINFLPKEGTSAEVSKTASARLAEDGSFEMRTYKPGDGVYKGQYSVVFTVIANPSTGVSLIPEKYTFEDSTPFEIDLDGPRDDLVYQLERLE